MINNLVKTKKFKFKNNKTINYYEKEGKLFKKIFNLLDKIDIIEC